MYKKSQQAVRAQATFPQTDYNWSVEKNVIIQARCYFEIHTGRKSCLKKNTKKHLKQVAEKE